jgi:hypothetical protein
LGYFKEVEKHAFTLSHCWLKLKDYEKWKASFILWFKDGKRTTKENEQETLSEGEAYAKHPRGHKASKTDLRREASALALGNTLKLVFSYKEEASAKRDEQRHRDKEEHMQSFTDIEVQQRKLDLVEVKERERAKELELKAKECKATLLAEESKIMMADLSVLDLARRTWFESKQVMICARDA